MNNGKKEFPTNGLEQDCTSKRTRKFVCFVQNVNGLKGFVKKSMNKLFRRHNKVLAKIATDKVFGNTLYFTPEMIQRIKESQQQIKEGKGVSFESADELDRYVRSL